MWKIYKSLTRHLVIEILYMLNSMKILKYWESVKKPNGFSSSSKILPRAYSTKGLLTIVYLEHCSKQKISEKSVKNMAQVYFIIELSTANPYSTYTQFKKNLFEVLSSLLSTEISHNGLNHLKLNHPIFISYSGFC